MANSEKTFSESWYRIAGLKLTLQPHVHAQRQFFRGEKWYVLRDPFNNKFYRLRPAAYQFISRLRTDCTVEDAWLEALQLDPDETPGQEQVVQLLAQLYQANLLRCDVPADSQKLFERFKKTRQREIKSRLMSIMFARFPLIDPDRFLKTFQPLAKLIISPLGAILWLIVVGLALKTGIDHFPELRRQTDGVLAPGNLPLLYASLVLIKTIHEFGHAFACRRYGGEVHTMGVMLLLFTPLPYMDASSSWSFRSRWRRLFVAAAGMIIEIFVAAIALVVWANTGPGTVHSLAYNMIFIASVSTVLFNINPLLRFDGYYILSDALDIPNLHGRATEQLIYILERYAFGCKDVHPATDSFKEKIVLVAFGILAWIYRIVIFAGILLVVADSFLLAGIIMFIICAVAWVLVPIGKMIKYLASSPKLVRTRIRAVTLSILAAALIIGSIGVYKWPDRVRAPGVIQSVTNQVVATEAAGDFVEVLAEPGSRVDADAPLLRLENEELDHLAELVAAQLQETALRHRRALQAEPADLEPLENRLAALQERLEHVREQQKNLIVRAPVAGVWDVQHLDDRKDTYFPRGMAVGEIIEPADLRFTAIVTQTDASRFFDEEILGSSIRVPGVAGQELSVTCQQIIAAEQQQLPFAGLGWRGGGPIQVDPSDQRGTATVEPFFLVHSTFSGDPKVEVLHNRFARIRFEFAARPLAVQWYRRFRQMLQRRYGL
jgi:putative peptide zinc metalloprotease protein